MTENLTSGQITAALKKVATEWKIDFNDAKILLALERLMARLEAQAELRDQIVFKGGFILLRCFNHPRFTRDLDAMALLLKKDSIVPLIEKAITAPLQDGFWFGDVRHQQMVPDDPYGAFRFIIAFQLGAAPKSDLELKKFSRLHLDIGFGDVITPAPSMVKLPAIVDRMESVSSLVYPLETIIAEKLETLIKRGSTNSRAKDVFDLATLIPKTENHELLKEAITKTFENRETPLPKSFHDHIKTWISFFSVPLGKV